VADLQKSHNGSHGSDPMLSPNANGTYVTMKGFKFDAKLLCLLRTIQLIERSHHPYLLFHYIFLTTC